MWDKDLLEKEYQKRQTMTKWELFKEDHLPLITLGVIVIASFSFGKIFFA